MSGSGQGRAGGLAKPHDAHPAFHRFHSCWNADQGGEHTRGSLALLYRGRFLFTGDHLWGKSDGSGLEASSDVCWFSWSEQTRSMERLLAFDFEWVLPGHGPRFHAPAARMRAALEKLVLRMKRRRG